MNQIREIQRINDEELSRGLAGTPASWHAKYAQSAWCFVGNLDVKLTEGDVIAVLSEYGEIDDMHLVREEDTGKSKGFAFCKYEDARSCALAVDNLCGVSILGRSLRVDHVENYRLPKSLQDKEEELQRRLLENKGMQGHAYEGVELANEFNLGQGQDLFAKPVPSGTKASSTKDTLVNDDGRRRKKRQKEAKRLEKESRKRERAEKRMEREEKRRIKRAHKIHDDGDDNEKDIDIDIDIDIDDNKNDDRKDRKRSKSGKLRKKETKHSKTHKKSKKEKDKERSDNVDLERS